MERATSRGAHRGRLPFGGQKSNRDNFGNGWLLKFGLFGQACNPIGKGRSNHANKKNDHRFNQVVPTVKLSAPAGARIFTNSNCLSKTIPWGCPRDVKSHSTIHQLEYGDRSFNLQPNSIIVKRYDKILFNSVFEIQRESQLNESSYNFCRPFFPRPA